MPINYKGMQHADPIFAEIACGYQNAYLQSEFHVLLHLAIISFSDYIHSMIAKETALPCSIHVANLCNPNYFRLVMHLFVQLGQATTTILFHITGILD